MSYQYTSLNTLFYIDSLHVHVTSSFICLSVGTVKMLLYSAPIQNEDTFYQRLFYACQTIRIAPGAFESLLKSMIRCVHVCIGSGGANYKYLL